jgi:pimeloyl-ACP methyl ester carboxylesterase
MSEFTTASDGIVIAYERLDPETPNGLAPVMLVHGFGSSRMQNWKSTGWFGALTEAGFAVVAMDCRGHGISGKPHEERFYGHDRMAEDVIAVMDAAAFGGMFVLGYSMGGFIGLRLLAAHPERVLKLALGGVGAHYLQGPRMDAPDSRARLADALLTDDRSSITDPRARMFRAFAEQPGKDRIALAACMRAMSPHLPVETLAAMRRPVLVVCGDEDEIAGRAEPLAASFFDGKAVTISGRDHMTAVGDRRTRQAVTDFFFAG